MKATLTPAHFRLLERKIDAICAAVVPKSEPRPAEPQNFVAPPHPLTLNPNEGMWMHAAVGPYDGWFSFGEHGNPPFDTPVQVLMVHTETGARAFVAIGIRSSIVDPGVVKERWEIRGQFTTMGCPHVQMTHWRMLSAPPSRVQAPEPRP